MLQSILKSSALFTLFFLTFSSCSLLDNTQESKGKFNIRKWENHTPELLKTAVDDQLILNVANENVIEFDMKKVDDTIYLLYTTDKKVMTAKKANQVISDPALKGTVTQLDWIEEYTLEEDNTYDTIVYRRAQPHGVGGSVVVQAPVVHKKTTRVKKGVWLRLFKGTVRNQKITWQPILITETPMEISSPKIAISITAPAEMTAAVVAVTNKSFVTVFDDRNMDGIIDIVTDNLLGLAYGNITQLNTWNDDNKVYISGVADRNLFTGYFQDMKWHLSFNTSMSYNIQNMSVCYKSTVPYASWYNNDDKNSIISIYDNKTVSHQKWLTIDTLIGMQNPKVSVKSRVLHGTSIDDIFVGGVNPTHLYFQMFRITDFKSRYIGPIIQDWNEVYDFSSNSLGQVVYVRVNFDQKLIFAGLNTAEQWEPIQISSPPPVFAHPQTSLQSDFITDNYTLTVFKQVSGSIYLLAGIN